MSEIGSGSGSSYPSALDTDAVLEVNSPNASKTKARAEVPNDLAAAVVAIETELGTDPAGTKTDVKTFLQTEHGVDGTHSSAVIAKLAGEQTFTGKKRFSSNVLWSKGADIASAATLTPGTDGNYFDVTGTTGITAIASIGVGTVIKLHADGALSFTHHATDLILPNAANITATAGDEFEFIEYATGKWRMTSPTAFLNWQENYILNDLVRMPYAAGDYLIAVSLAEVAGSTSSTLEKVKEIQIARSGTLRIYFELHSSVQDYNVYAQIYRNGVGVGTGRASSGLTYEPFSEDISGWAAGDLCQLYVCGEDETQVPYVRYFKIKNSFCIGEVVIL